MIEKYYTIRFYIETAAGVIGLLLILGLFAHCIITYIYDKKKKKNIEKMRGNKND